ncbi:MAG: rhodanese-like domain-containing protein [Burkholderiaceae bacterium]
MRHLSPQDLADRLADPAQPRPLLLDVRQPWEYQTCHLPDATLVPLAALPQALAGLDPAQPVVCICHHGMRSLQAAAFLERQGFADVANLTGGIDAWSIQVDPGVPRY